MTIRAELDNMRERINAATDGPWAWSEEKNGWGDCGPNLDGATEQVIGSWGHDANGIFVEPADAEFIAHARTDMERLLDAVEAVLRVADALEVIATERSISARILGPSFKEVARNIRDATSTALEGK